MSSRATVSVLTISDNSGDVLAPFFSSLLAADSGDYDLDIIMIDRGSADDSVALTRSSFPQVDIIEAGKIDYGSALNLGLKRATGEYIVILECNATLDIHWLTQLVRRTHKDERVGLVQGNLMQASGPAVSARETITLCEQAFTPLELAQQEGVGAEKNVYASLQFALITRDCLEDVGVLDVDLLGHRVDLDFSIRCQNKGWGLRYESNSLATLQHNGRAKEADRIYFETRNQLYLTAKFWPLSLADTIIRSEFCAADQLDNLYTAALLAAKTACTSHASGVAQTVLRALAVRLPDVLGAVGVRNFFSQLELQLGLRRIRVAIYDHAGHFAGGGQRYIADLAALIQDRYEVTYLFNKEVDLAQYADWYDLDLSRCAKKIVPIPFFEERDAYTPDESMALLAKDNVFDVVAAESANYDIFINANMLGKVNPLALHSIFICHFPDKAWDRFSQVDKYDQLVVSGEYSRGWVKKRWNLEPTFKLYPAVQMYNENSSLGRKENIILSVSRFEVSGSKKQFELIKAFQQLCRDNPAQSAEWKLILAGGSTPDNTYFEKIQHEVATSDCDIEIKANVHFSEIRDLYSRASIFWHACGLNESRPERVEHFGMTTVEAMQNYCVPIVIDGGGQAEIVVHGETGYRFSTLSELCELSLKLMRDKTLSNTLANGAFERSKLYTHEVFSTALEELLTNAETALLGRETCA